MEELDDELVSSNFYAQKMGVQKASNLKKTINEEENILKLEDSKLGMKLISLAPKDLITDVFPE